MSKIKRSAVDTSKFVVTLHGVDSHDRAVLRRNLKRAEFVSFFAKPPPGFVWCRANARPVASNAWRTSDHDSFS